MDLIFFNNIIEDIIKNQIEPITIERDKRSSKN
jgi:hypothetical protein